MDPKNKSRFFFSIKRPTVLTVFWKLMVKYSWSEFLKRKIKIFYYKRKIHTNCDCTLSFTKVASTVGLFMLKKNLDLFLRSTNTPFRNSSVKVEKEG